MVSPMIKHDKCTMDSFRFFRRFSFHDVNVTLSIQRNSDSLSLSMLHLREQTFIVGRGVGDDFST